MTFLHKKQRCPRCKGRGHLFVLSPTIYRDLRMEKGLSLREVARKCGISAPYLSDIELGRRQVLAGSPLEAKLLRGLR